MRFSSVVVAVALSLPACGRSELDLLALGDAAPNDMLDAAAGVGIDRPADAATDLGIDGTTEAGFDAAIEAETDAAVEAPMDATTDVGIDAAVEAGDAATDSDARDAETSDAAADAAVCAWGGFAPAVIYAEGSPSSEHPTYVATGDFNRDGHLDFVATDAAQTASVYLNLGDGTLAPQVTYATGAWTNAVVTGDFNGDGWTDIAAANGLPSCGGQCCASGCDASVAVLLNLGDGTFASAAFFDSGGRFASGLAVGDMNGDRHLDFVLTNYNTNTLAVLLGQGDGTFGAPATYAVANPNTIAVADLDGNGALDVVVGLRSLYPSSIETFFNDGAGALTAGATYNYGTSQTDGYYVSSSIVVGDFDGLKGADVAVSDTVFGDVILYSNSGNGVLAAPASFGTLARPGPLVAADFDRDGHLDLATTLDALPPDGGTLDELALLLLGDGHGGFSAPRTYGDFLPWGITTGDVNGDGYPDLVTGNSSWVTVLASQCGTDASDAGAPDGADAACPLSQPADHANWHVSDFPQSLVDNGDGTVTDNDTGLTWMKGAAGETTDGGVPIYTSSLATAEAACPCPWRLPQRIELLSIVDYSRYDMALNPLFLAPAADTNIAWTATGYETSGSEWFVSLIEGEPSGPIGTFGSFQVRCVRGSTQPPAVRYTLHTGEAGVAEVSDNGTGLVWKQESEPGTYAWQDAKAQCARPYRLPTISELQTLVDSSTSSPAIDPAFFGGTRSEIYLSATAVGYVDLVGYFWYVNFADGSASYASSSSAGSHYNARCVR